jgi:hypothetical protein
MQNIKAQKILPMSKFSMCGSAPKLMSQGKLCWYQQKGLITRYTHVEY